MGYDSRSCRSNFDVEKILATYYGGQAYSDLENEDYEEPDGNQGAFTVECIYDGAIKDFSKHVLPGGTRITKRRPGQNGFAEFWISDFHPTQFNLPIRLVRHLEWRIWNRNKTQLYFRGPLHNIAPRHMSQRPNGTLRTDYRLTVRDLTSELDRRRMIEVYENRRLGYMIVDAFTKYAPYFDVSNIDVNAGREVKRLAFGYKTLTQFLSTLFGIDPSFTLWIDEETFPKPTVYLEEKQGAQPIALIDESNIWDLIDFKGVDLAPDDRLLANVIWLHYQETYNTGNVDVYNAGTIVYGNSTSWYNNVEKGAEIIFDDGGDEVYTVTKNNSSRDGTTEELWITPAYTGSNDTNVSYHTRGTSRTIRLEDDNSVNLLRSLRDNDGLYEVSIEENGLLLTRDEAWEFANSLLVFANPLLSGGFSTDNTKFNYKHLQCGQTIRFNCPDSIDTQGIAVFNEIVIDDQGRGGYFIDGDYHDPNVRLKIDLTDRELFEIDRWRAILASRASISVNDDTDVKFYRRFTDHLFMKICGGLTLSLGAGSSDPDTLTILDSDSQLHTDVEAFSDTLTILETGSDVSEYTEPAGPWESYPASTGSQFKAVGATGIGKAQSDP